MPEKQKLKYKAIKGKTVRQHTHRNQTQKTLKQQKAGAADICSKDIDQLLMGNPPVSIGGKDISAIWKDTIRTAKDLDKYSKGGWGNYPGAPPNPDCVIL
jgi:hypothetical protein